VRKKWLNVPCPFLWVTWHYVEMLEGIPAIKPRLDNCPLRRESSRSSARDGGPSLCIEVLTAVGGKLAMTASELDHAIWITRALGDSRVVKSIAV
jgi:hypothetical protein